MKKSIFVDILIVIGLVFFSWGSNMFSFKKLLIPIVVTFILSLYSNLILLREKSLTNILKNNIIPLILVLFCFISSLYSVNKLITVQQSVAILVLTLLTINIAIIYSENNFLRVYAYFIVFSITMSILVYFVSSQMAFTITSGESIGFKGIFIHKNVLARNMLIGSILIRYYYEKYNSKKMLLYIVYICYILIIISQSFSSTFILICYFIFKYLIKRKKYKLIKIITISYIIITLCFIIFNDIIASSTIGIYFTQITGKSISFTGRMSIWKTMFEGWKEAPIFGNGYDAFWKNDYFVSYVNQKANVFLPVKGSHNGYFDALVNIGLIGFALIIIILIKVYRNRKNSNNIYVILSVIIMINFFENYLLGANSYWFIILYYLNLDSNKKIQYNKLSNDKMLLE